jgi:hypothetical protein
VHPHTQVHRGVAVRLGCVLASASETPGGSRSLTVAVRSLVVAEAVASSLLRLELAGRRDALLSRPAVLLTTAVRWRVDYAGCLSVVASKLVC